MNPTTTKYISTSNNDKSITSRNTAYMTNCGANKNQKYIDLNSLSKESLLFNDNDDVVDDNGSISNNLQQQTWDGSRYKAGGARTKGQL